MSPSKYTQAAAVHSMHLCLYVHHQPLPERSDAQQYRCTRNTSGRPCLGWLWPHGGSFSVRCKPSVSHKNSTHGIRNMHNPTPPPPPFLERSQAGTFQGSNTPVPYKTMRASSAKPTQHASVSCRVTCPKPPFFFTCATTILASHLKFSKGAADVFQKRRSVLLRTLFHVVQALPQERALRVKEGSEASRNYSPARVADIPHVPKTVPEGGHHTNLGCVRACVCRYIVIGRKESTADGSKER